MSSLSSEEVSEIPTRFLNIAKKSDLFDWMVSIRRKIHENPELGYEEFETSKLIREELDKMGIQYKYPFAVTGVIGFIVSGKPPFVAIRADMDALALQELVEWEHKSKNEGRMHACGHDAHVTMVLGAARILQDHRSLIKGTVVLVFQPAEEGGGGAKKMIAEGAIENIEAIFGLHSNPLLSLGQVECKSGSLTAGSGRFEAEIIGKGGHGATPHQTIDPILAAAHVVVTLQQIISRESDPFEIKVLTVAKFHGGSSSLNVIPDCVNIGGTFRAFSVKSLEHLKQRIEEVIVAQAAVHRCKATVKFNSSDRPMYPPTVNDNTLHKLFQKVAADMLGEGGAKDAEPVTGAEDFSFYQQLIPGYFFLLGMKDENWEQTATVHSPYFKINEDALPVGAALHAALAVGYLLQRHPVDNSA